MWILYGEDKLFATRNGSSAKMTNWVHISEIKSNSHRGCGKCRKLSG